MQNVAIQRYVLWIGVQSLILTFWIALATFPGIPAGKKQRILKLFLRKGTHRKSHTPRDHKPQLPASMIHKNQ
jgi:hypothetical protein